MSTSKVAFELQDRALPPVRRIRVEGKPSMPRCTSCHQPITEPAMVEVIERPIARLLRDGSIIRDTSQSYRLWCRPCADKEP